MQTNKREVFQQKSKNCKRAICRNCIKMEIFTDGEGFFRQKVVVMQNPEADSTSKVTILQICNIKNLRKTENE